MTDNVTPLRPDLADNVTPLDFTDPCDPRGWPLMELQAQQRLSRRAQWAAALREHSHLRRPGAIPLPGYLVEWADAPLDAQVIMAAPILAIGSFLGWLAWNGGAEVVRQLVVAAGMVGVVALVALVATAAWYWLARRGGY